MRKFWYPAATGLEEKMTGLTTKGVGRNGRGRSPGEDDGLDDEGRNGLNGT